MRLEINYKNKKSSTVVSVLLEWLPRERFSSTASFS
jgi:hypothetical protein